MSRSGPSSPASTDSTHAALRVASPPHRSSPVARASPKVGGIDGVVPDLAAGELVHRARRGGGELVEAVVAVEHQHVHRAELTERVEHRRHHRRIRHADRLTAHACGIGERAEEVEGRGDTQLTTRRAEEPHRRVISRCEAEADAGRFDAGRDTDRAELDLDAERLQHVGGAAAGRRGAVAVLDHPGAGAGCDQRGERRDVHRAGAVSAGAARIDRPVGHMHLGAVGTHGAHERGELAGGFALRPQCDDEARRLHVGDPALEDLGQCGRDFVGRNVVAPEQPGDDRREEVVHGTPQSHQRSWSSTPRAMSPSWTCDVPSTIVSWRASR